MLLSHTHYYGKLALSQLLARSLARFVVSSPSSPRRTRRASSSCRRIVVGPSPPPKPSCPMAVVSLLPTPRGRGTCCRSPSASAVRPSRPCLLSSVVASNQVPGCTCRWAASRHLHVRLVVSSFSQISRKTKIAGIGQGTPRVPIGLHLTCFGLAHPQKPSTPPLETWSLLCALGLRCQGEL